METENTPYPFTSDEWKTCLKVLTLLKDEPLNNPDNNKFKGLITKIKKNSRKQIRKEGYDHKKAADIDLQKRSAIVSNAIEGKTNYGIDLLESGKTKFTELNIPQNCYCCNRSFKMAHYFYSRICPKCAEMNYEKRQFEMDLTGHVAIITGCRVKVGYSTTLKLLRAGAKVAGTSRFPALALETFQLEEDYNNWKNNLIIYGLDLRDLKQIDAFIGYFESQYNHLEILINNAAQTIRYPDNYYLPLLEREVKLLNCFKEETLIPNSTSVIGDVNLLESNESLNMNDLPLTRFGQPVDNRNKTSWNSKLEEVSLMELLEVNLINQIAPYHLIKALKPMMLNSEIEKRHIINVTSSEGIFSYLNKTEYHPHTNMTKASLNMMTRTSASDFVKDEIYMNSVDVGWISTGANEELRKKQFERAYVPPLDSVDGASRIMDPIYTVIQGEVIFGNLLKNYKKHEW
ncbi:MAG: NAD(P)-dependent dehydrogenase (short-subunit alcohol dehydrogenase family) [Crocinitomix sp.]|jgi:NAD(P)-dependent dehydrogenase (short-subunit alcohol dehydrogenase family)